MKERGRRKEMREKEEINGVRRRRKKLR